MMIKGENLMVGLVSTLLEPRIIFWFLAEIFLILVVYGVLQKVRRRNRLHRQPRAATKTDTWVKKAFEGMVGAVWSVVEAICVRTQKLIRLIYLPGAGTHATTTSVPGTLQHTQLEESPHPQQKNEEDTIQEEFQSRHQSAEEELLLQHSPLEEGRDIAMQMISQLTKLWNGQSLRKGKRNMKDCFNQIHLQSHSSRHYEGMNGFSLVDDLPHPFKSLLSLDHGGVRFIDQTSLSKLDGMVIEFSIVGLDYSAFFRKVVADNSAHLNSFFRHYFESAGLSIDIQNYMDCFQFTCKSANKCVRRLKTVAALLHFMDNELTKADCISFDKDLRTHYFSLCASGPKENLIQAVDSISDMKWSAHHIYQMLVLFEAIADVLRALGLPVRSDRIFQQMRANFKRVFDEIKCLICDKLNGSECAITCVRHPATDFLLRSIELIKNHNSIVLDIFVGDRSSSLSCLLSEVISCWAKELEKHSMQYTQGRKFIFLLNNLTHFVLEITSLLDVLISNDESAKILKPLRLLIKKYTLEYLEKCWGPIRDLLKLNCGEKPCLSSLISFTSRFNDICNCQRTWVLQINLKKKLRNKIRRFIIPSYKAFLEEVRKKTEKYKTEKLEVAVDGLFKSEYKERILLA